MSLAELVRPWPSALYFAHDSEPQYDSQFGGEPTKPEKAQSSSDEDDDDWNPFGGNSSEDESDYPLHDAIEVRDIAPETTGFAG